MHFVYIITNSEGSCLSSWGTKNRLVDEIWSLQLSLLRSVFNDDNLELIWLAWMNLNCVLTVHSIFPATTSKNDGPARLCNGYISNSYSSRLSSNSRSSSDCTSSQDFPNSWGEKEKKRKTHFLILITHYHWTEWTSQKSQSISYFGSLQYCCE